MAAPKRENSLSLGHLTCTEGKMFTKQREHKLKKSINRPMVLQADFTTLQSHQHLKVMHLQQRWQELKERELAAQQHNRQLLQQFEEAQDTLRKMLNLTTAMKTIRMEYERYVEESTPRWEQQLKEKTQAAQKKRMEDYLKTHIRNTEDTVTESHVDRSLFSQGPSTKPQRVSASQQKHSQNGQVDDNQDFSSHLPYMQSFLQTHLQSQAARFPIRAPYHSQGSSHAPLSFLSPPIISHPSQLHHLTSTPAHHHHSWLRQNLQSQASPQSEYPWSWTAGAAGIPSGSEALWGRLFTEEPPPERVEAELSTASSSKRERGGGSKSSYLSQELDIKPVRLSSGAAESSESSRESSQTSRDKRKKREKRGRSRRTSSERERYSSHESSQTSSAIITAAVTAVQSSESDASSEKGRTSVSRRRRTAGFAAGSPSDEKVVKERTRSNEGDSGSHKEESESTAEESRNQEAGGRSPEDKPESSGEESGSKREEESGSVSIEVENGGVDEIEKESSSSAGSSAGEKKDEEEDGKDMGEGDEKANGDEEKEDSQREQQEERDVKNDDEEASETTEEEEEQQSEDEMEEQEPEEESDHEIESDKSKNEGSESEEQGSASSQDEEVDGDEREGGEDKMEEKGESDEERREEEEEEQQIDEAEERDSEDSIIIPENKSRKMHVIPEEESEDEDEDVEGGSETGSCDDEVQEFSDEDIEHLLAPQEQLQKKGEDAKAKEKPKALCDKVEIFQVELDKPTKTNLSSDSEEFDDFYD